MDKSSWRNHFNDQVEYRDWWCDDHIFWENDYIVKSQRKQDFENVRQMLFTRYFLTFENLNRVTYVSSSWAFTSSIRLISVRSKSSESSFQALKEKKIWIGIEQNRFIHLLITNSHWNKNRANVVWSNRRLVSSLFILGVSFLKMSSIRLSHYANLCKMEGC
jgi:hypothetical protein